MDRSLATLLRSLQTSRTPQDAAQLLPSATGLLSRLSNPLNVSLLVSQLLANDILYPGPVGLSSCRTIFSAFYTAAIRFAEEENNDKAQFGRSHLSLVDWTRAVVQGADDQSPRWRHLLVLGGLLLGMDGQDERLPRDLRHKIETALFTAANLSLQEKDANDANSQLCVVFVLNTVFPLISDLNRSQLHYDLLLPELIEATYFSREGLEYGYWLGTVDADVIQVSPSQFHWDIKSISAIKIRDIKSRALVSSLGPLSRLTAHSIENVINAGHLSIVLTRLSEFSRNVALSWRQTKLSEVDVSEEAEFLDDDTRRATFPDLLQLLRNIMFSLIITLRAIVGRILLDAALSSDAKAPTLAIQTLHVLRDIHFISHRFGQHSSSQYMFVNYTSIDILNQFPAQAESFLTSIRSAELGKVPTHPVDRLNDLFFLNTAEHFTLALHPEANGMLVEVAMPYVAVVGDSRLSEIYEAAHSVLLAVFAAPQNGAISAAHVPFYIETLFQSFPTNLAPRQFRLAVKSLMQVSTPRSTLALSMPQLQEVVLDMLHSRLQSALEVPLPSADPAFVESAVVSEKSTILLSIIENLSFLPAPLLQEWLVVAAGSLRDLHDVSQRNECRKRFWTLLSSGEMDVERAALCVAWWTSRGGREIVLFGDDLASPNYEMSGGLGLEGAT